MPSTVTAHHQMDTPGLGPRKTLFVVVTVVGCIAILWPKVFYPMMFGVAPKQNLVKDHRGTASCCDVVLDQDTFMNVSTDVAPQLYRKRLVNMFTGEISLRQERPPHLRPDAIHPAMRERGRAIPTTPTIPIVERSKSSQPPPKIVEGRPGPIPGMRPPMGAGSVHQAQPKGNSMGFIMPLYTIGIIAFFIYTIMKIVFKKQVPNAPYGAVRPDPNFRREVFGYDNNGVQRGSNKSRGPQIVVTAIEGLIDAADEQLSHHEQQLKQQQQQQQKQQDSSLNNKENAENSSPQNGNISNGHAPVDTTESKSHVETKKKDEIEEITPKADLDANAKQQEKDRKVTEEKKTASGDSIKSKQEDTSKSVERKKREGSNERAAIVLGMELTASCEGGHKWGGRPPTPVFISHHDLHSSDNKDDDLPEPQSIYLEGSLPHESQILVADAETKTENIVDEDFNGTAEEPAVILSSKMTLSLINLTSSSQEDSNEEDHHHQRQQSSNENERKKEDSPDDEDMEIINGEENGNDEGNDL